MRFMTIGLLMSFLLFVAPAGTLAQEASSTSSNQANGGPARFIVANSWSRAGSSSSAQPPSSLDEADVTLIFMAVGLSQTIDEEILGQWAPRLAASLFQVTDYTDLGNGYGDNAYGYFVIVPPERSYNYKVPGTFAYIVIGGNRDVLQIYGIFAESDSELAINSADQEARGLLIDVVRTFKSQPYDPGTAALVGGLMSGALMDPMTLVPGDGDLPQDFELATEGILIPRLP